MLRLAGQDGGFHDTQVGAVMTRTLVTIVDANAGEGFEPIAFERMKATDVAEFRRELAKG